MRAINACLRLWIHDQGKDVEKVADTKLLGESGTGDV
jgi:hypothetical protein